MTEIQHKQLLITIMIAAFCVAPTFAQQWVAVMCAAIWGLVLLVNGLKGAKAKRFEEDINKFNIGKMSGEELRRRHGGLTQGRA